MADALDALRAELSLDDTAIAFLESLPADARETLCRQIREAADAQYAELDHAVEDAAAFVPAPLRRRARKLLLG